MEDATCREGAIFGGECKVKAKFGGGASLGPCFCQKFIQAIDLKRILVKYLDLRVYVALAWIKLLNH